MQTHSDTSSSDEPFEPLVPCIASVSGVRVHLTTAMRWCQRNGTRLRSAKVGGRRMTKRSWVRAFLLAGSEPKPPQSSAGNSSIDQKKIDKANREIDAMCKPAKRGRKKTKASA